LLPFLAGQSHDSFTLLSVKHVMLYQHCQRAIQVLCTGYKTGDPHILQQLEHQSPMPTMVVGSILRSDVLLFLHVCLHLSPEYQGVFNS
jgi:hypothetical protein